jgi:hypothetical protein
MKDSVPKTDCMTDPPPQASNLPASAGISVRDSEDGNASEPVKSKTKSILPSSIQSFVTRQPAPAPTQAPIPQKPTLLSADAIADRLEYDPDELDRRFDAWLGDQGTKEVGTPHFGDGEATRLCKGLSQALGALWAAFGGEGPGGAIAAWTGPQMPEPQAFAEAAEGLLCEYLSRMLSRLKRWLEECDPSPDEIADVASWLLFDAKKELEEFQGLASKELSVNRLASWRGTADHIERLLLGEWETRSCDEVYQRVQAAFGTNSAARALLAGSEDTLHAEERADMLVDMLREILQGEIWRGYAAACDRAAIVLIAALNAVLRAFRKYAHTLLSLTAPGGSGKRGLGKVLQRLSKHALVCVEDPARTASLLASRTALASAAAEASRLAEFCKEAQASQSPVALCDVCSDVLVAFSVSFEREGAELGALLADHFAETHRHPLKEISFSGLRCIPPDTPAPTILSLPCEAAQTFLEEAIAGSRSACSAIASDAVIRIIVRSWVRAFSRSPPRLSSSAVSTITSAIDADESAIRRLAATFGAEAMWANVSSSDDPLQPLREIREMFRDRTEETIDLAAKRLDVILGIERGRAAASAVRFAIAH